MAKTKSKDESKSATFARLFQANQELLKTPSIAEVMKLFEAETGRTATAKDRGVAANVKSRLRKKLGLRRGRRRRRGRAAVANGTMAVATAPRVKALALEDAIDDCIYLARRMESERLADVIRMLRRARNHLIVLTGNA